MLSASKPSGLARQAYDRAREEIVAGARAPGDVLYEIHLAEQFGMSRTPVREALQSLARDGFLQIIPSRGYLVPRLSPGDILELYELRENLEGLAAARAAQLATPYAVQQLELILSAYAAAADWRNRARIGESFHGAITSLSGNTRLVAILGSLQAQISLTRVGQLRDVPGRQEESMREHRAILSSIEARDAQSAERHARYHVRVSYEVTLRAFQLEAR